MAKKSSYEADLRKKLKEAFDEVDTDKSGNISHDELKVMLNKAGYEATDKVTKNIIESVDADGNGTLDFEEFMVFFLELGYKIQLAMKLTKQFEELDTDKSGFITKDELRQAVSETSSEGILSVDEIDDFIEAADADGDGKISLEEWMNAMIDIESDDEN